MKKLRDVYEGGNLAKTFASFLGLATLVVLLGSSSPSLAVLVQSVSNLGVTNVVFFDNFENDPISLEPINAQVGNWTNTSAYTHVLTNASPGGPSVAAQGSRFLQLIRPGGASLQADFGSISSASLSKILVSFSLYVPSSAGNEVLQISLGPTFDPNLAGVTTAPLWLQGETNNIHTYLAGNEIDTGVTFQDDIWQIVQIAYTFGPGANDDTFTVSVNGNTSAAINAGGFNNVVDPASFRFLSFRTGENGAFYLDAVPEPSMVMLLFVATVALYRFRCPKRG